MENTKNGKTVNKALMMGTALVSLSTIGVSEAQAAAGSGAMSAIILAPVAITSPLDLHFGALTVGLLGTAVMDTADGRTVTGGVTGVTGGGAEQSSTLSITGDTGVNIDVAVTATVFTVNDGGGNTMNVNTFNLRTNAGGTTETINMTASPTVIPVGATLNVGAAQTPGTYTGTYNVTANYQ